MKKMPGIALTVTGIATVATNLILKANAQGRVARSVSIIGASDGPTSVFVAGKVGGTEIIAGMVAGMVLLAVGIFMLVKKH